jgi:phosphoglycerate dehydrogenase-like enzyme
MSQLGSFPNVILTPHSAFFTQEALTATSTTTCS